MKRPSFQFYPADWRKDMALQSCSIAARGFWIDLLCIAHECEPYGHLTVNGRPMSTAQIARHTGVGQRDAEKLMAELVDSGVASVTAEGGFFSRRMVRDEDLRSRRADGGKAGSIHGQKGAEHGAKGGRPITLKGVSEPPLKPPPSSSSSSSSSNNNQHPASSPPGFVSFWETWPISERKQAKGKCLDAWKKATAERDAAVILEHVARLKNSPSWQKDNGQFIPAPLVYLSQRRWEGADEVADCSPFLAGAI